MPPGLISDVLLATRVEHFVFDAWQRDDWPEANELGALIVMGGTMNVDRIDAFPFLARSRALMSDALEQGLPTLGVCLGSQMMARVLGAGVHRATQRNAFFAGIEPTSAGAHDPVIAPFTSGLPVLQFHEDTFAVPDQATALATSATSGLHQAFRYGDNAYAIQFHFEVDTKILHGWLKEIGPQAMTDDWGASDKELMAQADQHIEEQALAGRELVRRFLTVAGIADYLPSSTPPEPGDAATGALPNSDAQSGLPTL